MTNDDDSQPGSGPGDGTGDADSWVAEWVGLFEEIEETDGAGDAEQAPHADGPGRHDDAGDGDRPDGAGDHPWGDRDAGADDRGERIVDEGRRSLPPPPERPGPVRLLADTPEPDPVIGVDQPATETVGATGDVVAGRGFELDQSWPTDDEDDQVDDGPGDGADSAGDRADAERRSPDADDLAAIEAWQRAQERNRRQARLRANQRAARQMRRQLPDRSGVQVAGTAPSSARPPDALRRLGLATVALIVLAGLTAYLVVGFGPDRTDVDSATPAAPAATDPADDELALSVGADVAPATIEQLATSTVQLVLLDDAGQPQCAGSGIVVATDGTVLTNAHVVRSDAECTFTTIGVGVTADSSSAPDLLYRAEVVLLRLGVDLAVLRIAGPLDESNGAEWPRTFTAAPLGDSGTVELGDQVRVLGYPVIGGDTITLTTGTVSGFTSQVGLGNRALIKTDASISAGNSGGLAIDDEGRVIGIPTKARASDQGPAVDCRPVEDTNGDGVIGDGDTCVSVGGFLNGIRPINLSLPLLAAAGISDPEQPVAAPQPPPPVSLDDVDLFNPRFALDVSDDNLPVDLITTAVAGIPRLCFFVDWERIPAEASTDGSWYLDNEIQVSRAAYSGRIRQEESGQLFWICIDGDDGGLDAGVYEVVFYLDRQVAFVEGIELTEAPVEQVEVTWTNETGVPLCGLAINPLATSRQIGLDELPDGTVIPPGGQWSTRLPRGEVVVEAYDCQDEPVANEFEGLPIVEPVVLQINAQ